MENKVLFEDIKALLSLVRLGIGHTIFDYPNSLNINWQGVQELSTRHGVSAVALDGVDRLPEPSRPAKVIALQWIGEVLQQYEYRYEQYCRTIAEMAAFYNAHGYKMMILKGYACAVNWPKPEHRPSGDIDIWLFGKQKEADSILSKEKGIKIDNSHHHHTVFYWRDFMIENHYDFVNVYARKSSAELELLFKEMGQDDSNYAEVYGEKVYMPSPNLHALFLIRHMVSHFAAAEITLRQVLDWAFFVEKQGKDIDWKWLLELLDNYHMMDFFNCINAICVEDFGFDVKLFPVVQFLPGLKEKVLDDILDPAYGAGVPQGLIRRLVYKYRRWQGNAWKQRLCYNESRWTAFLGGVWAKLLKPASF